MTTYKRRLNKKQIIILSLIICFYMVSLIIIDSLPNLVILIVYLGIFSQSSFTIHNDCFVYREKLFGLTLFKRTIHFSQIKHIKFDYIEFGNKAAFIVSNTGKKIKVTKYEPATVYEHLHQLCLDNKFPTIKTELFDLVRRNEELAHNNKS